jgi:hypothetical protein
MHQAFRGFLEESAGEADSYASYMDSKAIRVPKMHFFKDYFCAINKGCCP